MAVANVDLVNNVPVISSSLVFGPFRGRVEREAGERWAGPGGFALEATSAGGAWAWRNGPEGTGAPLPPTGSGGVPQDKRSGAPWSVTPSGLPRGGPGLFLVRAPGIIFGGQVGRVSTERRRRRCADASGLPETGRAVGFGAGFRLSSRAGRTFKGRPRLVS